MPGCSMHDTRTMTSDLSWKSEAPSTRDSMLEKIGGGIHQEFTPQKRQQTLSEMRSLLKVWEPLLIGWTQAFVELEMEDTRKV